MIFAFYIIAICTITGAVEWFCGKAFGPVQDGEYDEIDFL